MKAERKQPKQTFVPVVLTLETQEEVDGLHALFVHRRISDAAGFPGNDYWRALDGFRSHRADELAGILLDNF